MNIFVIGRCLPEETTGLIGVFEFQQAVALGKYGDNKVTYLFCDNRSIKSLHIIGKKRCELQGVQVYGTYLPVGGIPVKCFNKIKYHQFKELWTKAIAEQGTPDIVHAHFPLITTNEYFWDLWKENNIKVAITEHWSRVLTKSLRPNWKLVLNRVMQDADIIISVSELLKKSMLELSNTERNIYVIPNMVSEKFQCKPDIDNKVTPSDDFYFISVARLVKVKCMDLLIEAFARTFKGEEKIRLTIVGDGPERKGLQHQIDQLGLQNQVHLTGFLPSDKVAEMLKQSNCFVSASNLETFGVPWIEAWCCGLPVIGAENGPIDSFFTPENSRKFVANDVESLQAAMVQIYTDRNTFDSGQIATKAYSQFGEEAVVNQLMNVFSTNDGQVTI